MNENSKPRIQTVKDWLSSASLQLSEASIRTARLDSEIILAHTLRKPRIFLHAHPDHQLEPRHKEIADARLALRLDRVPIAYIIGHKDFYGRRFYVSPAVLVPRPESEAFFPLLEKIIPLMNKDTPEPLQVVDVGTGSGVLGITTKLEHPELNVTLVDISTHALNIARKNTEALEADVTLLVSNLLDLYPFSPSIILANLPYVDESWDLSPELSHEPSVALFAKNSGLDLIFQLIEQSSGRLNNRGFLLLEADLKQHEAVIEYGNRYNFALYASEGLVLALQKNT